MINIKISFLRLTGTAFFVLLFSLPVVQATHIQAGDIKGERTSSTALTYKFTLNVYTSDIAGIDQSEATLNFGDLTSATVGAIGPPTSVGNGTSLNVFVFFHTYSGVGFYKVGFREENRNGGILNMSNSVQTAFYIELGFLIDPFLGLNSSPTLSVPPIDFGSIGEIYTHNPGASDKDGDSLAYKLVTCKSSAGVNVLDYRLPGSPFFGGTSTLGGPAFMTLDPVTGDIVWNTPSSYGLAPRYYNIAIMIEEWRLGVRIGYVIRDMQIEIAESTNNPPVLKLPNDTCVVAGSLIQQTITATDIDGDALNLQAFSSTFSLVVSPALSPFPVVDNNTSFPIGTYRWQTDCAHIREQPYEVVYKVQDNSPVGPNLADVRSRLIYVKAPKPQNLTAVSSATSILLTWNLYACPQASKIRIYRKECGDLLLPHDPCDDGVPAGSGYVFIGEVSASATSYNDTNNGLGLSEGIVYCYTIVATFPLPGNGVSFPANESCNQLLIVTAVPALVSVLSTSLTTGQILMRWFAPLDSGLPLPYEYEVWRASSDAPTAFSLVTTLTAPPSPVDTFFIDSGLNTDQKQYFYKTRMVGDVDFSSVQSSIALTASPGNNSVLLSWNVTKVCLIDTIEVYRSINGSTFSLVAMLFDKNKIDTYKDIAVQNCDTVCYYILIKASYCDPRLKGRMYSLSPTRCTVPLDDSPPVAPKLKVMSCGNQPGLNTNILTWNSLSNKLCNTINGYNIYYAPHANQSLSLLTFVTDTTFTHSKVDSSLAGCYYVVGINYKGVLGAPSTTICVDNCTYYQLPNLMTRNNDGLNDLFEAYPVPLGISAVTFNVYNSWGAQVFAYVGQPTILWNGNDNAGKVVASGVYYYEAKVNYYRRLNPDDETQIIKGWIHILGE